jgi:uncharacterized protein with von Willebrand factor type A (vWA) domain
MIFSDGWDRGETHLLARQMAWLNRSTYKLFWLNPLSGNPGYHPVSNGMRAALPYLDYFLPAGSLYDFTRIEKKLRQFLS